MQNITKRSLQIIASVIIFSVIFNANDFIKMVKRIGSELYYVRISAVHSVSNAHNFWKYTYLTEAYSATGTEKSLEFTASHVLRSGAYLRIYVRNNADVISWEEIPLYAIPPDARKRLREKNPSMQ
ncbi:YxeA family protein [Escherichia coli]|uniref:YxeA family protein n=1 Tax=Escherichia coli TaxID=562 RepID=UPI0013026FE3|nr:YxeA family protein [Escherichia coli]KAE9777074.1 YxeA family protein [Escherichia coli]MXJ50767.1 YxeA family protein [Escherichia coli]